MKNEHLRDVWLNQGKASRALRGFVGDGDDGFGAETSS